jgi:flagellar motor switch protein FliG
MNYTNFRHFWRQCAYGLLGALVSMLLWSNRAGTLYAQVANSDAPSGFNLVAMEADIARIFENQAKALIERHLRPEQFQILVTVKGNPQPGTTLPYVPSTLDTRSFQDFSPEELRPFISRVDLEILLSERFKAPTREKIQAILSKKLALDSARGDRITFSDLGIELDTPQSELAQALSRAEAESREIQARLSSLSKERDDAQRELSTAKNSLESIQQSSNQKIAELIVSTRKEIDDRLKEREKPSDLKEQSRLAEKSFYELNMPWITGGVLILAALLLLALTSRFAVATLAKSFGSIGDAVRNFGEKVAEAVTTLTPTPATGPQPDRRAEVIMKSRAASDDDRHRMGPQASLEQVQARILAIQNDLVQSMNPTTEGIIVAHVGRLVESGDTVAKAVVTLELLGKDKANEIFQLLDSESQAIIREFMRSGSYTKPKTEVMLEAAEEVKTKLLMEVFGEVRGKISAQVASRILKLRADDLALVAKRLSQETLPRLFLYLDPKRLAEVLSALKSKDEYQYAVALKALPKVPGAERLTELDKELIATLDEQITAAHDDSQKAYLGWYKAIADSLDDDVAEELRENLAAANPQLGKFVRDQMIAFGTFFLLLDEVQEELIQSLSSKNLAALVIGLNDQQKAQILVMFDKRRQELIAEDMEALSGKGQRQLNLAHRQAKNLIVANIKALKGSGSLDDFIDKNRKDGSSNTTGLSGNGSGNAA